MILFVEVNTFPVYHNTNLEAQCCSSPAHVSILPSLLYFFKIYNGIFQFTL